MRQLRLFLGLIAAISFVGCDMEKSLKGAAATIAKPLNDFSDVGVISELGWLSKLLRDSAQGSPAQKKVAKDAVAALFGLTPQDLGGDKDQIVLAVSVVVLDAEPNKELRLDVKFSDSPYPADVARLFPAGSGWNPMPLSVAPTYHLPIGAINAAVQKKVERAPVSCSPNPGLALVTCTAPGQDKFCAFAQPGTRDVPLVTKAFQTTRGELTKHFALGAEDLPPAVGTLSSYTEEWGRGGGSLGSYALVFAPEVDVRNHPKLRFEAWLHTASRPERAIGSQRKVSSVDFVQRCTLAKKINRPGGDAIDNPTPPVESNAQAGKLCWYAFDIAGPVGRSGVKQVYAQAKAEGVVKD